MIHNSKSNTLVIAEFKSKKAIQEHSKEYMTETKPQTGDLIQSIGSNYIVLDVGDKLITLKEISTSKVGFMPNTFTYKKTGIAPNGRSIFEITSEHSLKPIK